MTALPRQSLYRILVLLFTAGSTTAAGASLWTGTSGGLRVTISQKEVVASDSSGTRVFPLSLSSDTKSAVPDLDSHSGSYEPLSLVGPYLSLEREISESLSGAAHVSSVRDFVALDLKEPNLPEISLTRWFTEEQLVSVLKKDSFVAQQLRLPRAGMDSLKTLADAFKILNNCRFSLGDGSMTSFAFYELKGRDQVAVRIGLNNSCIVGDEFKQLGLLLPVPPALETDLRAAATGRQGFLMKDSRKLFGR